MSLKFRKQSQGFARARARQLLCASIGVVLVSLSLFTIGSDGALTANVNNTTNTAGTATFLTCTGATQAAGTANTTLIYRMLETMGPLATDTSGNNQIGTYTPNGIVFSQTGPCPRDTGRAITLDGKKGSLSQNAPGQVGPNIFTESIWFNTTTTTGGLLIGLGNAVTGASTNYDRHIYMADNGQLYFGVYPNGIRTVNGPASYNDGRWHLATATLSAAGMKLYVDGKLTSADANTTIAQAYTGDWRIGYDSLTGWPAKPTSEHFAGSLAYAAVYKTAFSASDVVDQYLAGV